MAYIRVYSLSRDRSRSMQKPRTGRDEPQVGRVVAQRGRAQERFIARGLRSSEVARRKGSHHHAQTVHDELQLRLGARRKLVLG